MIRQLPAERVRVLPRPGSGPESAPRVQVAVDGRTAPQAVEGRLLEAAFAVEGGDDAAWLLFLTDDVPFEDALHIHLLDRGLVLLDSATLGGPYSTGSFELLPLREPRTVPFRFFGDCDWAVELLDAAAPRLPFLSEPRGVHRRFGFSRRFKVHGNPQPEPAR